MVFWGIYGRNWYFKVIETGKYAFLIRAEFLFGLAFVENDL